MFGHPPPRHARGPLAVFVAAPGGRGNVVDLTTARSLRRAGRRRAARRRRRWAPLVLVVVYVTAVLGVALLVAAGVV